MEPVIGRAVVLLGVAGCLAQPGPPEGRRRVWRELPGAGQPGALHSPRMTFDQTRKAVVLHGGATVDGPVTSTWELTASGTWSEICPTANMPALHSPAFAYDPVGEQLVLAGGSTMADFTAPTDAVWTCSSTVAGATWVEHPTPLPQALVGGQLVHDGGRNLLVLVGGIDAARTFAASSFATADLQTWQPLGPASPAAFGGTATNVTYDDQDERILALKNYTAPITSAVEPTNELWQLPKNAGHWSLVCGPSTQSCGWDARSEAALVHLGESLTTLAIGGFDRGRNAVFSGTWILDNDELVRSHDDPPARDRAGVAYNKDRQEVIVYGGNGSGCRGAGDNCDTTWLLELE